MTAFARKKARIETEIRVAELIHDFETAAKLQEKLGRMQLMPTPTVPGQEKYYTSEDE